MLYLLEWGEAMREAMGVMSCRLGILAFVCIRKYWICAFFQLFVRSAPSKIFNSRSFVSLSQSYMPHNTYTYVFLFFVSSHVCLIFPTQKTWLNFFFFCSSFFVALISYFHCNSIGFFSCCCCCFWPNVCTTSGWQQKKASNNNLQKRGVFCSPPL